MCSLIIYKKNRTVGQNGANVNHHEKVHTFLQTAHLHNWAHHWVHHLLHSNKGHRSAPQEVLTAGQAINHHTNWVHISMCYRQQRAHMVHLQPNTVHMFMTINCFHCVNISTMAVHHELQAPKSKINLIIIQRSMINTIIHVRKGKKSWHI